jgi:GMP synthase-like glutamine amidotransferase
VSADPDVVVWQLDGRPHEGIDYGTRLAELLGDTGLAVDVVAADQRVPDDRELRAPVHVVSGGTTLATSEAAWLGATRAALIDPLARARAGQALVIGVCLGAQLVAEQLLGPGATGPSPRGLHMGLHPVHAREPGWRSYDAVPHFHYYEIRPDAVRAGPTARNVLQGDHSEMAGITIGDHVLALQFHPELDVSDLERMIHHNADLLSRFGLSKRRLLQDLHERAGAWSPAVPHDLLVTPVQNFLSDGRGVAQL